MRVYKRLTGDITARTTAKTLVTSHQNLNSNAELNVDTSHTESQYPSYEDWRSNASELSCYSHKFYTRQNAT
jgi:hypothetical protein